MVEPLLLALGKRFGRTAVESYLIDAADLLGHEADRKHPGVPGRIDLLLHVQDPSGLPFRVVIEVKNTDWDRQQPHRVGPNIRRHVRQTWRYLAPLLHELDQGKLSGLQGALLYPARPRTPGRHELIERIVDDEGLTIVYQAELAAGAALKPQ